MKKTLLFSLILLAAKANAQSIAAADTLSAGDALNYYSIDTATLNLDATVGANVTWDYSNISANPNIGISNDTVINIADSPNATDYPNADYHEQFENGVQTFFSNTGSDVVVHGFIFNTAANSYIIKYNTDQLTSLELPMNIGDQISDAIAGQAVVPAAGTVNLTGNATIEADGTGTLLLSGNTYSDVIRVKTVEVSSGLALGQTVTITRTSYTYYSQSSGTKFPIFIHGKIFADLALAGSVTLKIIWSKDNPQSTLAINDEDIVSDIYCIIYYGFGL